jgi:hypothetical protein
MKAHIFCLKSQTETARDIESILRRRIFDRITTTRHEISDDYCRNPGPHDHEHCRLFLKFFKASMIRPDDFAIHVGDGKGVWRYMGGYYNREPFLLEF